MVTAVKISDTHKRKLDRLREDLARLQGNVIAAQDVLERLIDIGSKDPDLLIATYSKVKYPLPASRIQASLALAGDWMGKTSEEDIDRTLYGRKEKRRS